MAYHIIGIYLGGTKLAAGLTDTEGQILRQGRQAVENPGNVRAVVETMAELCHQVSGDLAPAAVLGVGVAISGVVDRKSGVVLVSRNLGWQSVPLRNELQRLLPWEVFIGNDVNLATLGEWQQGAGQGVQSLLGVFIGTGIGAGLILDGRLYEGTHGAAGEIGRALLTPVPSGKLEQLESVVTGPAMCRRITDELVKGHPTTVRVDSSGQVTPEEIGRAEMQGDELSLSVVADVAETLGMALANALTLLDPQRVVLGGGVIRAIPTLVARSREVVRRHLLLSGLPCQQEIVAGKFGREAPIIGAATLARMAGQLEPVRL